MKSIADRLGDKNAERFTTTSFKKVDKKKNEKSKKKEVKS